GSWPATNGYCPLAALRAGRHLSACLPDRAIRLLSGSKPPRRESTHPSLRQPTGLRCSRGSKHNAVKTWPFFLSIRLCLPETTVWQPGRIGNRPACTSSFSSCCGWKRGDINPLELCLVNYRPHSLDADLLVTPYL